VALTLRARLLETPSVNRPEQDELSVRIAQGDVDAVAEAYTLHHGAVRAFARRLVGDEAVAEDLVHEVFVTLPSAIRRFRNDSTLRTFLISIAVNHARHHVRAASRRRSALERYSEHPRADAPSTPEQDVERKRLALMLSKALDALPVDQRVAFVLCEVEERSSREVSEIVDAPEATVRTRLFHARKKLRELLAPEAFQ
jgi:RNA polymerase sigma-70 factor (ECF subfamily)